MVIDEDWGIATERITAFFCSQPDITADGEGYSYGHCRITLTPKTGRALENGPFHVPKCGWKVPMKK